MAIGAALGQPPHGRLCQLAPMGGAVSGVCAAGLALAAGQGPGPGGCPLAGLPPGWPPPWLASPLAGQGNRSPCSLFTCHLIRVICIMAARCQNAEDKEMTIYGYARVSTNGQDLTSQEHELLAAGCAKGVQGKGIGCEDRPC